MHQGVNRTTMRKVTKKNVILDHKNGYMYTKQAEKALEKPVAFKTAGLSKTHRTLSRS